VVARSQYRGTLKRRTVLFDVDAPVHPGQEVFHSDDPGQPAGSSWNAAPLRGNGRLPLALVESGLPRSTASCLGSADGPALQRVEMPYAIPIEHGAVD
jgi:hypothetical protein